MSAPNPYAPPQAALKDAPAAPGSAFKAVSLGVLADFGGTLVGGFVFGILYLVASGGDVDTFSEAVFASPDHWEFYAATLIGLAFSVLGGYVCARIARRNEMKLGAAVALAGIVLGELIGDDSHQLGTHLSLILASIVAVMVGARLGYAKNRGTK